MDSRLSDLNCRRVIEFEKEIQFKLNSIIELEKHILHIEKLRREWLEHLIDYDRFQSNIFQCRLDTIKVKAHNVELKTEINRMKIESTDEILILNHLIYVTKPFERNENQHTRDKELFNLTNSNTDYNLTILKEMHQGAIHLNQINFDLKVDLLQLKESHKNELSNSFFTRKQKIRGFMEQNSELLIESKEKLKKITSEYLIMRHNSKVASEVFMQSQDDVANSRSEFKDCLDTMKIEAENYRIEIELSSESELRALTSDLRDEVVMKENEAEIMKFKTNELTRKRKEAMKEIRKQIKDNNKNYGALQLKRRDDVTNARMELEMLRYSIASLKDDIFTFKFETL